MLKSIISAQIFQQSFFVITQTVLLSYKALWEAKHSKSGMKLQYTAEPHSANHWRVDLFTLTAHWTAQRSVPLTCANWSVQNKKWNALGNGSTVLWVAQSYSQPQQCCSNYTLWSSVLLIFAHKAILCKTKGYYFNKAYWTLQWPCFSRKIFHKKQADFKLFKTIV